MIRLILGELNYNDLHTQYNGLIVLFLHLRFTTVELQ